MTIENHSPMIMNGIAISGEKREDLEMITGFCLPLQKTLEFPARTEAAQRLGIKCGSHDQGADVSGL